jgi:FHS family L-fucose permease-like MFS transporter
MSQAPASPESDPTKVVPREYLFPFILVTSLFALWGFANDFTNPLVRVFKEVFLMSNLQSSLVQFAFYGGYATMAIPAALVIRRYSYRTGIIVGLALYALGALITIPASIFLSFWVFLIAFYILTFGLAFLETTANPYILSFGHPVTATQRLNLAQAFNPLGCITGMLVAGFLVLPHLAIEEFKQKERDAHPEYAEMPAAEVDALLGDALKQYAETEPEAHTEMKIHDLRVVRTPYVSIAVVVLAIMLLFVFVKMPDTGQAFEKIPIGELMVRISTPKYIGGVFAQAFYVGAQIMCWTFIIHYGMTLLQLTSAQAQRYNTVAMGIFLTSRFICTFLLKYMRPGVLLGRLAVGGILLTLGTIFLQGFPGLYCLVGISACMSLMFPTIYGIALEGLNPEDAKLASAGLIFAIVGGAVLPLMQGWIIDMPPFQLGSMTLESVRVSFVLPLVCFVVIAVYGFLSSGGERAPAEVA